MTEEHETGRFVPAPTGPRGPAVCGDTSADLTEQLITQRHVAFHTNDKAVTAWLTGAWRRTTLHVAVASLAPHRHSWSRWPLRASARSSAASIRSYLERAGND